MLLIRLRQRRQCTFALFEDGFHQWRGKLALKRYAALYAYAVCRQGKAPAPLVVRPGKRHHRLGDASLRIQQREVPDAREQQPPPVR